MPFVFLSFYQSFYLFYPSIYLHTIVHLTVYCYIYLSLFTKRACRVPIHYSLNSITRGRDGSRRQFWRRIFTTKGVKAELGRFVYLELCSNYSIFLKSSIIYSCMNIFVGKDTIHCCRRLALIEKSHGRAKKSWLQPNSLPTIFKCVASLQDNVLFKWRYREIEKEEIKSEELKRELHLP